VIELLGICCIHKIEVMRDKQDIDAGMVGGRAKLFDEASGR
jgi:hypothetical protein